MPLRPDCLAIVNNFAFLLGGEELGPDGEFHASSKVYRYDPRQNSWLRMADMSVPRSAAGGGGIVSSRLQNLIHSYFDAHFNCLLMMIIGWMMSSS